MSTAYLEQQTDEPQSDYKVSLPSPKKYTLRITDAISKRSKVKTAPNGEQSGDNPMIEVKAEVISPTTVNCVNPETKEVEAKGIAGLQAMFWFTLTAKAARFTRENCAKLRPPIDVSTLDDEQPNFQQFIGREFDAILRTKVTYTKDPETNEHILLSNGEKKVEYQHSIVEIL